MQVTLIDYTQNAVDKLIYTKATRLTQGADTRAKIAAMSEEDKLAELKYMARTIPGSWEFVTYTFEFLGVTRAFTHQLVRTRTGSYAQQTMRMLPMEKFTYGTGPTIASEPRRKLVYDSVMKFIQDQYDTLLSSGAEIEDARGILPTNIHTNIIAQFSLRTLSEMNKSRSGKRTQGEYRDALALMNATVFEVHPWARAFILPEFNNELRMLEDLIEHAKTWGQLSKSATTDLHKALDTLRKNLP
jgi:flavin-dependent thymidylate synthase